MIFLFEKKIHLRPLPDTPCLCKLKLRQFKLLRTVFDYFEIANYFWEFTEESGYFQWKKLRLRYWEISNVLVENTENVWHERLLRILFEKKTEILLITEKTDDTTEICFVFWLKILRKNREFCAKTEKVMTEILRNDWEF